MKPREPKHSPKRRASWRAAYHGQERSYRVWTKNALLAFYVATGVLSEAEALDPDRVAEALTAAAQAADPEDIKRALAALDQEKIRDRLNHG